MSMLLRACTFFPKSGHPKPPLLPRARKIMDTAIDDVVYTGSATATGSGRAGNVVSDTKSLDLALKWPAEPEATNPEELFAAGYAACFNGALQHMLSNGEVAHAGTTVRVEADLGKVTGVELDHDIKSILPSMKLSDGFGLAARVNVSVAGVTDEVAMRFAEAAHAFCPYSKAVAGNIEVTISAKGTSP